MEDLGQYIKFNTSLRIFYQHIGFEKLRYEKEIDNTIEAILERLERVIHNGINVDKDRVEETIEKVISDIVTVIDLSRELVGLGLNGSKNKVNYNKIQEIIDKATEKRIVKDLSWKRVLSDFREKVEHDGIKVKSYFKEDRLYVQTFRRKDYPNILYFMNNDKYVDFGQFLSYSIIWILEYLSILLDSLVESKSTIALQRLDRMSQYEDFKILNISPSDMEFLIERYQEAMIRISRETENEKQDKILYERIALVDINANRDKLNADIKKLLPISQEIEQGKFNEADSYLKSEVYFHLGNAYLLTGDYDAAREKLKKAIVYDYAPIIYGNLLQAYLSDESLKVKEYFHEIYDIICQYEQIEECINKDGIDDELVVLNNNIGSVYMQLEKYELAIKYYERCMKLKPSIGNEAAYNIALCYKKTNNLLASLKWFEKAVYINSKDDIAYCNILKIAIKEGKLDTYEKYLLMAIYNNLSSNIIKWCEYTLEQEFFRYRLPLLHQIYINLMEVNLERLQEEDKSKVLMIIKKLTEMDIQKMRSRIVIDRQIQ